MAKRYAFFDIDMTINNGHSMRDFLIFLIDKKLIDKEHIDIYMSYVERMINKEITYNECTVLLMGVYAKALSSLKANDLRDLEIEFAKNCEYFDFVPELFKYLETNDFEIHLVSASGKGVVEAIGNHLGVKHTHYSEIKIVDGVYTDIVEKVLNNQEKRNLVKEVIGNDTDSFRVGFGDSMGDIPMLEMMDLAVLIPNFYNIDIKTKAKEMNWVISNDADEIIASIEKVFKLIQSY